MEREAQLEMQFYKQPPNPRRGLKTRCESPPLGDLGGAVSCELFVKFSNQIFVFNEL